ncbi:MAG: uncharacterized protein QG652_202 [Pseudomonadota bacterium]|nr:uncharacterized protein [Pseudomonadota bacterium]
MQEFTYISAFAAGLLGGVHCIGMCGGIVGALSFGVAQQQNNAKPYAILLAYNLARITSYMLAGALLGGVAALAMHWLDIRWLQKILQWSAALMMLLLGFYLAGWWTVLAQAEKIGAALWRKIEPHARKLLPAQNLQQAFVLGLLWGWLPCGLVYSILLWSVASANAVDGALLMLCFGLGTLPNLLAMGVFARQLNNWVRSSRVRQLAGVMVMGFGVWNLYLAV